MRIIGVVGEILCSTAKLITGGEEGGRKRSFKKKIVTLISKKEKVFFFEDGLITLLEKGDLATVSEKNYFLL